MISLSFHNYYSRFVDSSVILSISQKKRSHSVDFEKLIKHQEEQNVSSFGQITSSASCAACFRPTPEAAYRRNISLY